MDGAFRPSARLPLVLQEHGARWLDPARQLAAGGGTVRAGTAYTATRLLVPDSVAGRRALAAVLTPLLGRTGHLATTRPTSLRFDLDPAIAPGIDPGTRPGAGGTETPDPWELLAALREVAGPGDTGSAPAGLDHLLSTAEQPGGNPFAVGHGQPGRDGYGIGGHGRGPVGLTARLGRPGPGPAPGAVLLDTAVGTDRHPRFGHPRFGHSWFGHSWFGHGVVNLQVDDDCRLQPLPDPQHGPATWASAGRATDLSLLGALGSHVGHGSFIAGVLRQLAPAATVDAVAIMGADGVVAERTLIKALRAVADRIEAEPDWAQVLLLCLGYYAEAVPDPVDSAYSTEVKALLVRLARAGLAVFCAAGNDATTRPSYPAAFAVEPPFTNDPDLVPLTSVGAVTAAGHRADFSNAGSWVTAAALGVDLVSALPTGLDGSQRAPRRTASGPGGRPRSALDPDDFASGFGAWSGTSFATPVLAGEYLAAWQRHGRPADIRGRRRILAAVTARHPMPAA